MEERQEQVYSVAELTSELKLLLETSFDDILVEGELSTVTMHTSGHCYFRLKDATSQLQGVMWRSRVTQLGFEPETGMQVRIRGRVSVYEPRGQYQLIADSMQLAGEGALQLAFEKLKQRLAEEGLFDAGYKKPLSAFPKAIGLVTSRDGAALRDILSVLDRRFPLVEVFLVPAAVQGIDSAEQISSAIALLNRLSDSELPRLDLLIVGRGGGSMEDLWSFNDERVARAIFASEIPIVSAVGHETDFTISDFVADVRAATPSIAAEVAVPDSEEILQILARFRDVMTQRVLGAIRESSLTVQSLHRSHTFRKPVLLLERVIQQVDEANLQLSVSMTRFCERRMQRLAMADSRLSMLDPEMPLRRGYALVESDGSRIKRAAELDCDEKIDIHFEDGRRVAVVAE